MKQDIRNTVDTFNFEKTQNPKNVKTNMLSAEKKKKKDKWFFRMYMAVGTLEVIGAFFYETILQCVILLAISAFTLWCGFIIKKNGTEDAEIKDEFEQKYKLNNNGSN